MPLTSDISTYIVANIGTWISPDNGSNPDGNIYESFLPDEPDRACAVYGLAGSKPRRTLGKGFAWEEPRLRIVNRAATGGWDVVESDSRVIWDLLRVVVNQVVNGTKYIIIDPVGNPQPQDLDANNRPLYAQEFSVMKYIGD